MYKKRIIALLLVVACMATLFVGCQENKPEDNTPKVEYLRVAENKATEYKIVSMISDKSLVTDLATKLMIKTGAQFKVVNEKDAGDKAIYIGTAEQLAGKGGVSTELIYTTYEIKVDNDNIYVAIGMDAIAENVIEAFKQAIVKIEEGVFGIDKNISGVKNVTGISNIIPEFATQSGKMRELYDCSLGNYQITYQNLNLQTADAEVAAYQKSLEDAGYTLHQKNEINGSQFFTYTQGDTLVHCNYFKAMREFRIVYGPKTHLGSATPITDYEKKVTPSISIVGMTDNVLCMVYQAPDGSFVIVDGGWGTDSVETKTMNKGTSYEKSITYIRDVETDMANLWALLEDLCPDGEKPQVTWMITHADPDHICLPPVFMKEYKDRFDLNMVCYNFPDPETVGVVNGGGAAKFKSYMDAFIGAVNKNFPNAAHMIFHTGEKLYLPGAEIEFLFTPEDYWPNSMPWMNHTSCAWRITSEGKTIMITGDCEIGLNNQMVTVFGNYLKSDMLQLNHHGSNGATLSFYKKIQPSVAFWASQQYNFDYDRRFMGLVAGYEFNKYIRETAKDHYTNSETHTILLPSMEEKK